MAARRTAEREQPREVELTFDFPPVEDAQERARIEAAIAACVEVFYAKGAADPLLGPVFAELDPRHRKASGDRREFLVEITAAYRAL